MSPVLIVSVIASEAWQSPGGMDELLGFILIRDFLFYARSQAM